MKNIIIIAALFAFSSFLFAYNCQYFYDDYYIYDYFDNITEKQLAQIIDLKNEYMPKINELKKNIYIEKIKIDLEMCKENSNQNAIDKSMNLNIKYNKELEKIADEFLSKYYYIKNIE